MSHNRAIFKSAKYIKCNQRNQRLQQIYLELLFICVYDFIFGILAVRIPKNTLCKAKLKVMERGKKRKWVYELQNQDKDEDYP